MSSVAVALRDRIVATVERFWRFSPVSKTSMPQLQPEALPWCGVFIAREVMTPDGDGNAGEPRFVSDVTIAISVVRGFQDTATLDGRIDQDFADMLAGLLCDPAFVAFGDDQLFESVERVDTRRLYPMQAETYFAELRMEMTFRTRIGFPPNVPDDYRRLRVTTRPYGHDDAPAVVSNFDQGDA